MRYLIGDEIKFSENEVWAAKNYYYNDETFDEFFKEKNNEIKNATSIDEIVKAYNALTDDYYNGSPLRIYDDETKKYTRY